MSIESASNQWVCDLVAYEPGKPIEETARELGLKPEEIIKLASNENPLGPSPMAQEAMRAEIEKAHLYPDGGGYKLRTALAEKHGVAFENVVLGNGSNEIIELLCHSFLKPGVALIAAEHAFVVYKLMATLFGADYKEVPDPGFVHDLEGMADAITPETRLVFIANPNNPTGTLVGQEEIDRFIERLPDHVVAVFDEAYFEFLPDAPDAIKHVKAGKNVVVMRTFSKAQGLSALRIGYGLAPAPIAGLLNRARQPFNANAIAQAAALASIQDEEHIAATVENNRIGLEFFESAFAKRGWEFVPSVANFVLVNVGDGDRVFGELLKKGVIVRAMRGYKLPEWVRISVGTPSQNERCLAELDVILAS
ncbi:histidinol-phosphate transaminase [Akkermansiaceae bacterium]|nr:histidinol-phosphate transaminase [Akkermansiaceae bacterium]MDB4311502.1 histidinol-phosphate transaminase [bacterium]MDA7535869.1 histidinol-phosphate transaminase [Akkermansiaceae bacterium]MDA7935269.1 histidinol-phosphate transaminase [Akkermansiaceae bacterium]MDB4304558.1 histidinol-phosphate transaminase [Akkermansiaceae bacterium]